MGINNPENLPTTKVSKCIPSGFSKSSISSFRSIEKINDLYRYIEVKIAWIKSAHNEDNYFFCWKNEVINKRTAVII